MSYEGLHLKEKSLESTHEMDIDRNSGNDELASLCAR